ncbi:MAG: hypothetical protein V2A79_10830 [Planctomycetota bacterium]
MARPRKYIRVNHETIDGVSLHKPSGRYCLVDHSGKRVYFTGWREASLRSTEVLRLAVNCGLMPTPVPFSFP